MATTHVETQVQGWYLGRGGERASHSLINWLSRLGIGLLSFFAQLTGDSAGAAAKAQDRGAEKVEPGPAQPKCCGVYFPNGPYCEHPDGKPHDYTCPPGAQKMWWYCIYGTKTFGCGECTTGSYCYEGTFKCSIWWEVKTAC